VPFQNTHDGLSDFQEQFFVTSSLCLRSRRFKFSINVERLARHPRQRKYVLRSSTARSLSGVVYKLQ